MRQASTLQKVEKMDPTAAGMRDIFDMATINGARAAGFERLRKLEPGWRADIIGLSADNTRATPCTMSSHIWCSQPEEGR